MCHYMDTIRTERATVDITPYLPYVREIAKRMCKYLPPGMAFGDLMSYGTLGLIDAAGKYQPSRGVGFWTYAECRVRGAMRDGIRLWCPIHHRRKEGLSVHAMEGAIETAALRALDAREQECTEAQNSDLQQMVLISGVWTMARRTLSLEQYTIISLRYQLGCTFKQIAGTLGRSIRYINAMHIEAIESLRLAFSDNINRSSSDMAGSAPRHSFGGAEVI